MDKYKIIRKLGQGAQSVSYLANPIDSPTEVVVLKRIATNVVRPADVSVLLRLRHPGIVPCLAALQHEDQLVLVTPYYEGGDLEHYIEALKKQKKQLDANLIVKWTSQLVRALQYCHDQKVIHRDLKISNIFLSNSADITKSRVYLGGFGLARALDKTMGTATTLVGSPSNLSPEVISGQPYSFSSDVWSLGCLVYELLTFEKPFSSPSFAQVVMKVCNGRFDPLPAATPKFLVAAVNGMLAVDPKQRWLLAEVVESDDKFLAADKDEKNHIISETPIRKTRTKSEDAAKNPAPRAVVVASSSQNPPPQKKAASSSHHSRSASELDNGNSSFNNHNNNKENDNIVGALANSEELDQWIQWKHREFAQIDSILKKIKANENSIDPIGPAGRHSPTPAPGPASAAVNNNNNNNNNKNYDLDPKRAQRFVPSPRGKSNDNANPAHGLPLAPTAANQIAAAGKDDFGPRGGRRAVNAVQQKQDKLSLVDQQQQQRIQQQLQQQQESAEKRMQQRADLQKRIAEGRRAHDNNNNNQDNEKPANSGGNNNQEIVVATPSRGLFVAVNNNNNNNNKPQQQQQQQLTPHTPPPKQPPQHNSNNNNRDNSNPASPDGPSPANNHNNKQSSLKEEIARRRAEAKMMMSPQGAKADQDGQPVLEIVLPGNLKKFAKQ